MKSRKNKQTNTFYTDGSIAIRNAQTILVLIFNPITDRTSSSVRSDADWIILICEMYTSTIIIVEAVELSSGCRVVLKTSIWSFPFTTTFNLRNFDGECWGSGCTHSSEGWGQCVALVGGWDVHVAASIGAADHRRGWIKENKAYLWTCLFQFILTFTTRSTHTESVNLTLTYQIVLSGRACRTKKTIDISDWIVENKGLEVQTQLTNIWGTFADGQWAGRVECSWGRCEVGAVLCNATSTTGLLKDAANTKSRCTRPTWRTADGNI